MNLKCDKFYNKIFNQNLNMFYWKFKNAWLTLCGTRKLQFFYSNILPELKNRPMPKTVNAICMQIIKVKKS